jgi:Flp pilus assembly protein TadD
MAEQANKAAPTDPIILDTLGWILVEQGKLDRALPLLKQAAALAPANPDIRNHLGVALGKSGKPDDRHAARQAAPLTSGR